jgi:hypothetical protein
MAAMERVARSDREQTHNPSDQRQMQDHQPLGPENRRSIQARMLWQEAQMLGPDVLAASDQPRATEKAIGLVGRFARFMDGRDPEAIEHTTHTLVDQRMFGVRSVGTARPLSSSPGTLRRNRCLPPKRRHPQLRAAPQTLIPYRIRGTGRVRGHQSSSASPQFGSK